ncbi:MULTISPECIES: S8 family peptidase [Catenuloplanes]|uniref:Subtilisin family serine protease n=1 Tax=Catenuloplanes niger TaxID=587534 RepID=A0AAE3ZMZ6_9ACTN|nr:S8 family serine peptidase [Catenuloplanes niger]MDR7321605.1 subtilisin family serine protease [Catenuloplanes niger]
MTVHGNSVEVRRGPGREHVRFATTRHDGHVSVVPSDAAPLLGAGRVDPRLFDVTTLIEFGYDDRRAGLPLIVRGGTGTARATGALPDGLSAVEADRTGETWKSLTGAAAARRAGHPEIWLDGIRKPTLTTSVPQIGAPAAWQAGHDGTGAVVAVLDTGVDGNHPDLAGKVTGAQNFTEGEEDDADHVGHGTHVASTIAGKQGVAPGASLLSGKVCATFGCSDSWILAGMKWAAEQGADVINMSLGGPDTPGLDLLEEAVQTLTEKHGALFVIAAGNSGELGDQTVDSPGSADAALTVGAVDRNDGLAVFSSRGPRRHDHALKPEITAPGVDIVAAEAGTTGHVAMSGTSMATPHVAGAAAILAGQHDGWTAEQLKSTLVGSAKPNPGIAVTAQGGGRVDVARAVTQTVSTSPAVLSYGRQLWPHQDDAPVAQTLTYRNSGTAALDLGLSVSEVPAGLVTLSATTVTVPAGGTATVTVTVDTSAEMADRFYAGHVTATAGDLMVRTPFGVDREVESYGVTIGALDRAGAPAANGYVTLADLDRQTAQRIFLPVTEPVRLPKGRYALTATINGTADTTFAAHPLLDVRAAATVTIDARAGKPVSLTVPNPAAEATLAEAGAEWPEGYGASVAADDFAALYSLNIAPGVTYRGFHSVVHGSFAKRHADGTFTDSPFSYDVQYLVEDTMITGYRHAVRQAELATVKARHARHGAGANAAVKGASPQHDAVSGSFTTAQEYRTLPFTRTEFYNADHGVRWGSFFQEGIMEDGFPSHYYLQFGPPVAYRPGHTVTEQFNKAVFGPSFPDMGYPQAGRRGDEMFIAPPMYGDGAGREGYSAARTASRTTLYRDGQPVGSEESTGGAFLVPPAAADYRVEITSTLGAPARLSTSLAATWTFASAHTDPATFTALPMSAVVFTPAVDDESVAPKGRAFSVPVRIDRQEGSAAAANRSLTVEASFDDGRTWTRVPVRDGAVQLRHPDRAGFVSLRAVAVDQAGNTVSQTMIRAYEIR